MDTRRDFVRKMIGGGVVFSHLHANDYPALPPAGKQDGTVHAGPYTIDNPYADVIWNKVKYIPSATHVHVESQEKFDKIYHKFGLRHMPISNYYPSAPTYPIQSIRYNQYAVQQDFDQVYKGKNLTGSLLWNDIIMKGPQAWSSELPADLQAKLPFQLGDFIFKNVPSDVIVSPNAEHHSFTNAPLHACAPGSM